MRVNSSWRRRIVLITAGVLSVGGIVLWAQASTYDFAVQTRDCIATLRLKDSYLNRLKQAECVALADQLAALLAPTLPPDTTAPTIPTTVQRRGSTETTVNLTWAFSIDNVAVTGYGVYLNGTLAQTVLSPSVTLAALTCSSTYDVTVDAVDAAGNRSAHSVALAVSTQPCTPLPATSFSVPGGTSSAPTALGSVLSTQTQYTDFILEDGYYAATTITRPGITVRARTACQARIRPELSIRAANVVVDGVSVTAPGVAITVYSPGVRVENSCVQGFGKSQYGNGIWIFQEALDPANPIIIRGNRLDDWGGAQYSGGIAIGKAADDATRPTAISVEVLNNWITRGSTAPGIYNAAIQSFHPFLASGNYIDTVSGTSVQNKTFNSVVRCNEMVHVIGDGALYNRLGSNNVWEYNVVHDSDVAIDHFMGNGNVFRGNVIYRVKYLGRVKDQGIGSTNLTFEGNTFYGSTAWAGFIWDATSGGPLSNIQWRRNIFHTVNGSSIASSGAIDPLWDETDNIFWLAQRPSGTTGAGGSSRTLNPRFISAPLNFTVQEPTALGIGAPWPLPCSAF